jgi:sulfur carrier protein ThiS
MNVLVNLYSGLSVDRFAESTVDFSEGDTVADLLEKLKIPLHDVSIVVVNAHSGTFQQKLQADDRITLIPHIGGG